MLGKPRIYLVSSTRLINSIKHEHSCKILYLCPDNVYMHAFLNQILYLRNIVNDNDNVVERKYFTCPSRESNPGRWVYRQILYRVALKANSLTLYNEKSHTFKNEVKAVEVCNSIPRPCNVDPSNLKFVPEFIGTGMA